MKFIPERYAIVVILLTLLTLLIFKPTGLMVFNTILLSNIIAIIGSFDNHSIFIEGGEGK